MYATFIYIKFLHLNQLMIGFVVSGQKYALNEMKIVLSHILRKAKIETLGKIKDIQIRQEVVIGIESIPEIKFLKI